MAKTFNIPLRTILHRVFVTSIDAIRVTLINSLDTPVPVEQAKPNTITTTAFNMPATPGDTITHVFLTTTKSFKIWLNRGAELEYRWNASDDFVLVNDSTIIEPVVHLNSDFRTITLKCNRASIRVNVKEWL